MEYVGVGGEILGVGSAWSADWHLRVGNETQKFRKVVLETHVIRRDIGGRPGDCIAILDGGAALPPNAPRQRASSLGYARRDRVTACAYGKIMSHCRMMYNSITRCRAEKEYR